MTVATDLDALLDPEREVLRRRVRGWGRLHAAGIADRCFQRPTCFNNYKLADAVLNLELARSGVTSGQPGARLRDPALLRRRTLRWLAATLPTVAPATAEVTWPSQSPVPAAVLSDPHTYPLAYDALCTAFAVRAARLAGPEGSPALRLAVKRALWGLLGVTAPNGEVGWAGRGADQVWSLTATAYAASGGAALFGETDPVLAARLRRLADIALHASEGRAGLGALLVLPGGAPALPALDHYYSVVGSTSLALVWLELARDELADPGARRLRIPSEIDGATFTDPGRSGFMTRRVGRSWFAIHAHRDHRADPRQDFGLLRALRLRPGGWQEERPSRPGTLPSAPAVPSGGPGLVSGGRIVLPHVTGWRRARGGLELTGEWRLPTGPIPGRWRFAASPQGVTLRSTCPSGRWLRLTEWLPRSGPLDRHGPLLSRGKASVSVTRPFTVHDLRGAYANARQGPVRAYRLVVRCSRPSVLVRWRGSAPAPG